MLKTQLILALLITSFLMSCQPGSLFDPMSANDTKDQSLFSDRIQNSTHFFAIVKLKSPALLISATYEENKKPIVDLKAKQAVLKEQEEFEKSLSTLAPQSKIVFKYRLTLNAMYVYGPIAELAKIKEISNVIQVEEESVFKLPIKSVLQNITSDTILVSTGKWSKANSVKFIGAEIAHQNGIKGQGLKIGIIDTGVDYTHKMLGGSGSPEVYSALDPVKPNEHFPNSKVVGGIDLVGSVFAPDSKDLSLRIPKGDPNPMDENGHGTHVAGSAAGVGDGVNTYSGVAPDAEIYAIKVFGKSSTSDTVVISGLEFALDPNGDLDLQDSLDVVNLSLGGSFGGPKLLYAEAVKNFVTKGKVIFVAAAGNSGDIDFITGSPATVDEAISVAASVDNSAHNWQKPGIILAGTEGSITVEISEAEFSSPIDDLTLLESEIVSAGFGNSPYSPEEALKIKDKVALISRGQNPFLEKALNAQNAGAKAVIIYNNTEGPLIKMSGEVGQIQIPVMMITLNNAKWILEGLKVAPVSVKMGSDIKIEKSNIVDSIALFSSKGPRSGDLKLKPEISAPGQDIASAMLGSGFKAMIISGTSMASPHVAGAMALVKQAHKDLSPQELKALIIQTAKPLLNAESKIYYPLSRQGGGRIQVDQAIDANYFALPETLSLGLIQIDNKKTIRTKVTLVNNDAQVKKIKIGLETAFKNAIKLKGQNEYIVSAKSKKDIFVDLVLLSSEFKNGQEIDGWVTLTSSKEVNFIIEDQTLRVPFLGVIKKASWVESVGNQVKVDSDLVSSQGAAAKFELINKSTQVGRAYLFNYLGADARKQDSSFSPSVSKACDIQSVGYRIISTETGNLLQLGIKFYNPVTHWYDCEVTALIDSNDDQIAEQELAQIVAMNLPGLEDFFKEDPSSIASILFDAKAIREIGKMGEPASYSSTVIDILKGTSERYTNVVILEADVNLLARHPSGKLSVKIASQDYSSLTAEADDYFTSEKGQWLDLSVDIHDQSYMEIPEFLTVSNQAPTQVDLIMGTAQAPLLILLPDNLTNSSEVKEDMGQMILIPEFLNN